MVFEYAPAPESTKIVNLKSNYDLFIGGKFVKSKASSNYKTINPATEEVLSEIVEASQKDVDEAVKAARKAFKSWSKLSGSERGKYLYRLARIIQERSRELAVLESMNNGKPIRESRDIDIPWCPGGPFPRYQRCGSGRWSCGRRSGSSFRPA